VFVREVFSDAKEKACAQETPPLCSLRPEWRPGAAESMRERTQSLNLGI
jgi:hypothetical protein